MTIPMTISKERRQILLLSAILAGIAGALLYVYGAALLPEPDGAAARQGIPELSLPAGFDDPLFERADYKALKATQGVPVKPFEDIPRNPNPFDPAP